AVGAEAGGARATDTPSRGFGGRLPVIAGSSWAPPCVAAVFDWNMSPSLVDDSQPLSHNRHATVATTTRRACALMGGVPRRPASDRAPAAKPRNAAAVTPTGAARLGDD